MRFDDFAAMLRHWRERAPGKPAVRFARGDAVQDMSWAALDDAVAARAEALARQGGRCLGILCDGSVECLVEIFAAARAGLQVALMDANADEALLRAQAQAADVDALWGDIELVGEIRPALRPPAAPVGGGMLFFTSGTTEAARAVALSQHSLCASAWNGSALLPLEPKDTLLCMLPLNHVFGFVCGVLWGLHCGACVALGRGMRHYGQDCMLFRPTVLSAVPLLLGFLVRHGALNPELGLILVGAGDCPAALLDAARAGNRRVSFGYGLTETSSGVALSLGEDPFAMTVCPEVELALAPDGEILVRAPSIMMRGYYNDPAATAAALIDGVLHTGDLGTLDDMGRLRVTGRKKEMLVLPDGTKLFLPEYEGRLASALGGRECAVLLVEGRPILVLHGAEDEREVVVEQLKPAMARLPRGQQLGGIIFTLAPLPRTASGKIKRWELQQKVGQP